MYDAFMQLIEQDCWYKTLVLDTGAGDGVEARVIVTQPQGYTQTIQTSDVSFAHGSAHVTVMYPLIDEGRYEPVARHMERRVRDGCVSVSRPGA